MGVNFIFCHFKNDQKSIFELGKSLTLPKMKYREIFLIYLISRVFLARLFGTVHFVEFPCRPTCELVTRPGSLDCIHPDFVYLAMEEPKINIPQCHTVFPWTNF